MALIHGARGLIYFVHEWKPRFNESALLDDPEMLAAVTRINRQIHALALVFNAPLPRTWHACVWRTPPRRWPSPPGVTTARCMSSPCDARPAHAGTL